MDDFSELVLAKVISQNPRTRPTAFTNLNDILNGGFPQGRLIEIYGRSQIGKSSLAVSLFPGDVTVYFDLSRKLCTDYIKKDDIYISPPIPDESIFRAFKNLVREDAIIVIDDLTMLGTISDDTERFKWLSRNFMDLQRHLVNTNGMVIVLNQIRISPSTGKSYNPHEGCMDPAVKIKMHHAEKKADGDLVYLDIEKHFWGQEGERCTLLVSKNKVSTPSFYKSEPKISEDFL